MLQIRGESNDDIYISYELIIIKITLSGKHTRL